jgi:hypothetical protein
MPPLPTIANVFRCRWIFTRTTTATPLPTNVFHVLAASGASESDVAGSLNAAWAVPTLGHMIGPLPTTLSPTAVGITALDGTSAEQIEAVTVVASGSGTGNIIPNQAAVVSFHTAQRGARGRGRIYLGPTTEDQVNDGVFDAAGAAQLLDGWGDFIAALPGQTPSLELVIASYVHADAHVVTSLRVDSIVGTQRRRLDQLRA